MIEREPGHGATLEDLGAKVLCTDKLRISIEREKYTNTEREISTPTFVEKILCLGLSRDVSSEERLS